MQETSDKLVSQTIGRAIAKHRQLAGLTQAQVAEMLNISNEAVSRMERGTIMPTVARLIYLADIFGCETADLLTESSSKTIDQSRYLANLLGQLDEMERVEIMEIMERMIKWYLQKK